MQTKLKQYYDSSDKFLSEDLNRKVFELIREKQI
jgi:hypothetical protein